MNATASPERRRGPARAPRARAGKASSPVNWPGGAKFYLLAATAFVAIGVLLAAVDESQRLSHLAAANAVIMLAVVCCCFVIVFKVRAASEAAAQTPAEPTTLDRITGLPDEQYFWLRLREEYRRTRKTGFPLSVALLDVNGLASINERYGRGAGDTVLRHLAGLVESTRRASDVAARLNDDEIAIILLDCDSDGAGAFTRRLEHIISRQPPAVTVDGQSLTLWIGVCLGTASALEGETSPEELAARLRRDLDNAREDRDHRRVRWVSAGK